jgi:hypothetical protein
MRETSNIEHQASNAEALGDAAALGVGPSVGVWRVLWRVLDFGVAAVFIFAGVLKVIDPVGFANDIDNYKIVPWTLAVGLAFYLPWLEIFCALALVFRRWYRGALSILIGLTSVFIVATVAAKLRGLDITCGCFGHASQNWSFPAHMATDFAILAAVIALLIAHRASKPL